MIFQPGEIVHERYRVIQLLASGGMGTIYRAKDESLRVEVALKVTIPSSDTAGRIQSQATILAGLHHPNLPRVTDSFRLPSGGQILVMDFIPGEDLKSRVDRIGPLSVKEALEITLATGSALHYLHNQDPSIIHQDVKPGNIRITPSGQVMLVDFDLITVLDTTENGKTEREFGLTPGFAAPEQYNNMAETQSDQYSLAATLYFILTGVRLPDGLTRAAGNAKLPIQNITHTHIPVDIYTSLEKALSVNPSDRYPDIQSFMGSLLSIMKTLPNLSKQTTRRKRNFVSRKNNLRIYISFALVSIILILAGLFLYFRKNNPVVQHAVVPLTPSFPPPSSISPTRLAAGNPDSLSEVMNPPLLPPTQTPEILPTSLGGGSGTYAFVSEKNGLPQINLGFINSEDIQAVTNIVEGACQPDWSPNGKKIIFTSPCQNREKLVGKSEAYIGSGLFIIDLATGSISPLPSLPGGDFDADWSPDGGKIAFTSVRTKFAQIFVYEIGTDTTIPITNTTTGNRQPAWGPDGKTIAYSTNRIGPSQIWLMDNNGSNTREFSILDNGAAISPAWSPDGKEILFSQTNSLRLVLKPSLDTYSTEKVLNPRVNLASNPVISPDGNWILFDSNMDGSPRIYRMSISGSGVEPLTPADWPAYQPDWRP